jgi:hypothetical protein
MRAMREWAWAGLVAGVLAATAATAGAETSSPATGAVSGADPADRRFALRPYFFLSGVSGSVTADALTVPINSRFSELLDNVQISAFLAFTARKGRWGAYADLQYISLKGEGRSDTDEVFLELDNIIAEADATLEPAGQPTLRFLAGVRVYSIDQTLSITGVSPATANTTVVDPILGALGRWDLGEDWNFEVRGDIGGFGLGSEFTYQMMVVFQWDVSGTIGIPFGYRVLGYQIQDEDIWMNTRMGGLLLGVDFRF